MLKLNYTKVVLLLITLIALDFLWFQLSLKVIYYPVLDKINGKRFLDIKYGLMSWLLISILLNGFAKNYNEAFFLGLLTYGIYNTTNLATLKHWNLQYAVVDTIWGGCVSGLAFLLVNKYFLVKQ